MPNELLDQVYSGIGSDARFPVAPPLGWNPPPLDPRERDLLIKTVYGEARGEPDAGKAAVVHAILNRVAAGGYGNGVSGVVLAPAEGVDPKRGFHEFSPWNPAGVPEGQPAINTLPRDNPAAYAAIGNIVDKVYGGTGGDPTFGATHYYGYMPKPPPWGPALAAQNRVKIGGQTFVGGASGPGQSFPSPPSSAITGGLYDVGERLT
jgi:Cell Wall Hydrolase